MKSDFAIGSAVVNDAAEHITARYPLAAFLVVLDLSLARLYLHDSLIPTEQKSLLGRHDAVEHIDNIPVRHGCNLRPDRQPSARNLRVGVLNDGVVALPRDAYWIFQRMGCFFLAHWCPP